MNTVILELRADHHRMMRILRLIDALLENLGSRGSSENLATLGECFRYMSLYPDSVHHPREETLFDLLVKRDSSARDYIENLKTDHAEMERRNRDLGGMVDFFDSSDQTTRKNMIDQSRIYVNLQVQHMRLEEGTVFPLIENKLEMSDWKEVIRTDSRFSDPVLSAIPMPESLAKELERLVFAPGQTGN